MRIKLNLHSRPLSVRYTDSMNAALVAGMVEAGLSSGDLVGAGALPWTFGMEGRTRSDQASRVVSVTVSSSSERFAEALGRLDPAAVTVRSANGDVIDCAHGKKEIMPEPAEGASELMVFFASPLLVPMRKEGRKKTAFHEALDDVDLDAALRAGLKRRAGRSLDLRFAIDRLSLLSGVTRRLVRVRKLPDGRALIVPAFNLPLSLHGAPEDLRFAFLAGLGAKTHAGFGCPILPN